MPIKIPNRLPAKRILDSENIFTMSSLRAERQDIRPLRILILNLMPTKIVTETQLLRLLSNTPLQVDPVFIRMATHESRNTDATHLNAFYKTFDEIRNSRFDGIIITGAPVENIPFEDVDYWDELCEILNWTRTNVFSSFYICWAAQAALYYFYKVPKYPLPQKMFGVFPHRPLNPSHPLLRGFDEEFLAPHSRHTEVRAQDIEATGRLQILATSDEAGVYIISDRNKRRFFVTGHSEYDADTLSKEYFRDVDRGLDIAVPAHYFPQDDPTKTPPHVWRSHAHLLFTNWLNYFVYQNTPYDLSELKKNK